ncbi:DUF3795 domain-containing protein [Candidatus Bathyarchaeota archaeon]|nr:MAG: DUF3795 domain-containing protein [Candidatus Bathyarchaeota archaeon]
MKVGKVESPMKSLSKPKHVRSLIGYCGNNCGECKAFVATKNNSVGMEKLVAEEWSKSYGYEMKSEDINCVGCVVVEGPHIG